MAGRRTRGFGAIAGLGFVCMGFVAVLEAACGGDAFTTGSPEGGGGALEASGPIPDSGASEGGHGDGAVDAGDGWCATQASAHAFCEDFFRGVPGQLVEGVINGSIMADPTDFESPPRSMRVNTPVLVKGASSTAFASHALSKEIGGEFTLSSYFKIDTGCFPSTGPADAVSILLLDFADVHYQLLVALTSTAVTLVEIGGADGGVATAQPPVIMATGLVGSWQPWTLQVHGGIAVGKWATLTVGTTVLYDKATLKVAPSLVLQHPVVYFGATVHNAGSVPTPACKVGVDDILIDVRSALVP